MANYFNKIICLLALGGIVEAHSSQECVSALSKFLNKEKLLVKVEITPTALAIANANTEAELKFALEAAVVERRAEIRADLVTLQIHI